MTDPTKKSVSPRHVIGSSGLRRTGGYVSADFLPQLNGMSGKRLLTEMAENDPVVSAFLFAVEMMVRQVEWKVEAKDAKNKKAVKHKELVEDILFNQLTYPWADVVSQACTMFTYGFAPQEVTWRKDKASGMLVPHDIDLRGQETIFRWQFDQEGSPVTNAEHGRVVGMWQQDVGYPLLYIPMHKLLLFRTTAKLNNPEGRTLLRGAYTTWMRKKAVEEAEGRALLRAAGLVILRVPGELMSADADEEQRATLAMYQTLATNLANDRQGAVVLPSDVVGNTEQGTASQGATKLYDIEYKVADGRRSADMSLPIERMDKRIATTVMADFLLLGQTAVGSFALSDNKTALFNAALGGWLDMIASTFNRQLLKRWWTINGLDEETLPRVVPGKVQIPSLGELGAFITQLSGAGVPLFPDQELEEALRLRAGLPLAHDKTLQKREDMMAAQQEAALGGAEEKEEFWGLDPDADEAEEYL